MPPLIFFMSDQSKGDAEYLWCFHCECVNDRMVWEALGFSCPTPSCDGGPYDALPWDDFRAIHPFSPVKPVPGGHYPL